jgi:hypothetical protein
MKCIRALPFVAIVCLSAIAAAAFVAFSLPRPREAHAYAALMLVALGVGAEMLSYEQNPKGDVRVYLALFHSPLLDYAHPRGRLSRPLD